MARNIAKEATLFVMIRTVKSSKGARDGGDDEEEPGFKTSGIFL